MYKSVQVSEFSFSEKYSDREVETYKKDLKKVEDDYSESLERYILDNKEGVILDAGKIQETLFPEGKKMDVFLSHAHKDEDSVIQLAMYLEKEFGLSVFVDSCIWGNVYSLLRKIDDKLCKNKSNENYNYWKRNYTTANLYMILNTALHSKIDSSELFLFLGTNMSTSIVDAISSADKAGSVEGEREYIRSPWIYSELEFANKVEISIPERYRGSRPILSEGLGLESSEGFQFYFKSPGLQNKVSGDSFREFLKKMNDEGTKKYDFLDKFYDDVGLSAHSR